MCIFAHIHKYTHTNVDISTCIDKKGSCFRLKKRKSIIARYDKNVSNEHVDIHDEASDEISI